AFQDARRGLLGSLIDSLEKDSPAKEPAAIGAFGGLRSRLLEAFEEPPPLTAQQKPVAMPPVAEAPVNPIPRAVSELSQTVEPPNATLPPIPELQLEVLASGSDDSVGDALLDALLADMGMEPAPDAAVDPLPEPI